MHDASRWTRDRDAPVSIDDAVGIDLSSDSEPRRRAGVEPILEDMAAAAEVDAGAETGPPRRDLTVVRRIAIAAWLAFMVYEFTVSGLAFDRTRLLLLLCLGMIAATIGRRRALTVVIDWLPFAAILLLYDWTRNVAVWLGMPTQWHLAVDVDHAIFGVSPTAWLQGHLKHAGPPWWEIATSVVYMSYFIVPYAVAAVLWLRDRSAWRRYAACFVATTFIALIGYTLVPAAPPWAAAKCSPEQVVGHPHDPPCMYSVTPDADGGLLGPVTASHPDAAPYVERISARGWEYLNVHAASELLQIGQGKANLVAAVPSLHAGLTMLLALFMWPRVRALGKTLFMGYALAMAFTLVYTAEHYVFDVLLGWALAAAVIATYRWIDRRWLIPRQQRLAAESDATASDAAGSDVTSPTTIDDALSAISPSAVAPASDTPGTPYRSSM